MRRGGRKSPLSPRYTTVAIGLIQGFGYYSLINSNNLVVTDGLPAAWVAVVYHPVLYRPAPHS